MLHISTSSVLAAIDKAEQEFKVTIFARQKAKGLTITHAGRQIILNIEYLLEDVSAFNEKLAGLGQTLTGNLHLGCFQSISSHVLPSIIANLTRDHPGISIHIHEGDVVEIQNLLRDGTVDVILTYDFNMPVNVIKTALVNVPLHVAIALASPLIDHNYGGKRIVCLPVEDKSYGPNLVLLRRPDAYVTRIVQVFTQYCQSYFDSELYAGYIARH